MENFKVLVARLPERHRVALEWYREHAGQEVGWPEAILTADGMTYLATRAKGIYKPQWSTYALSIRESLNSPYPDNEPIWRPDGTWSYSYFQENKDPLARDIEYANRAMLNCCRDRMPVGVFRQTQGKPAYKYKILGVALVMGWENGYYMLEGFSQNGCAKPPVRSSMIS